MANRSFLPPKGYLEPGVCVLYGTITTTTNGAVAAGAIGKGIASATRTSAGLYVVTLTDRYTGHLRSVASVRGPAGTGVPTAAKATVANTYNQLVSTATKTIGIQATRTDTLAAADVTDTWMIDFEIVLKDSVLP